MIKDEKKTCLLISNFPFFISRSLKIMDGFLVLLEASYMYMLAIARPNCSIKLAEFFRSSPFVHLGYKKLDFLFSICKISRATPGTPACNKSVKIIYYV